MNKFEEAQKLETEYKQKLGEIKEKDFLELFAPMFEKFPQIVAVGWHQYTPSFNDGDPCVFLMGEFYPIMATTQDEKGFTEDQAHGLNADELEGSSNYKGLQLIEGLEEAFGATTRHITRDIAQRVFGDDQRVVISKSKITSQEYYCGY